MTRSSPNWKTKPGSFDTVHGMEQYPSDNSYGIPTIPRAPRSYTPAWMQPYRSRLEPEHDTSKGAIHFFLDDYRFESVWSHPNKALTALRDRNMTMLSPDFSLFTNWPLAAQIWNTYRNRWVGAKWSAAGLRVIPSIAWSTAQSYNFAFAGVSQKSVVAVSTVGIQKHLERLNLFEHGYRELIARLQPSLVLCYGTLPPGLENLAEARTYPTRWARINQRIK